MYPDLAERLLCLRLRCLRLRWTTFEDLLAAMPASAFKARLIELIESHGSGVLAL
jgi:hypothetical protein